MITLTATAREKVKELLKSGNKEGYGVRIGVQGGGCSGLSYKMEFTEKPEPRDKVFPQEGFDVIIDPKSYLYLIGTELDYVEELMGKGFKFNNPNVKKSCGCGESFSV